MPIRKFANYFFTIIFFFHCLGVTQLFSAYAKDSSTFVGMINMNEEETKKEKESEEDANYFNLYHSKILFPVSAHSFVKKNSYFSTSKNRINYQFIIESHTPPPDFCS